MLQTLTSEKHTWRLITSLYRDRLETEAKGDAEESMMVDILVSYYVIVHLCLLAFSKFTLKSA